MDILSLYVLLGDTDTATDLQNEIIEIVESLSDESTSKLLSTMISISCRIFSNLESPFLLLITKN